jgi:hypothetical protein
MSNKILPYETKIGDNSYRQIQVRTRTSRSHEFSSQGWDVLRCITTQSAGGDMVQTWIMAPASCLVLMAGVPEADRELGGYMPFAYGKIWGTPRNLVLLQEFIDDGTFKFFSEEDGDRFESECKKRATEIAGVVAQLFPDRVPAVAPKAVKAKGAKTAEVEVEPVVEG